MADCIFCSILKRSTDEPTYVTDLGEAVLLINFDQDTYPGQSLLIAKQHYDHLHEVPGDVLQSLTTGITEIGAAMMQAFGAKRINYQCLGNSVAHVHWHITPRYNGDPNDGWVPVHHPMDKLNRWSDDAYRAQALKLRQALGLV